MRILLTIFLIPFILAGCNDEQKITVYQSVYDTEKESDVYDMLEKSKDIEQANVIFIDDELFVALQVKPWKGLKKEKIEKKWQDKLEKEYPDLQVVRVE